MIIRTEGAYIKSKRGINTFKVLGLEKYQIIATLDNRTSKICQQADLKVFDLNEAQIGVNYPPLAPCFRSVAIAYDEIKTDGERIGRKQKSKDVYVKNTMNYEEFNQR